MDPIITEELNDLERTLVALFVALLFTMLLADKATAHPGGAHLRVKPDERPPIFAPVCEPVPTEGWCHYIWHWQRGERA